LAKKRVANGAPAAEKLGWRLGVQAYTFNRFTFYEAVDKVASLGLHYIEAYPGQQVSKKHPEVRTHHDMPPAIRREVRKKLRSAGVQMACYGVVRLRKNEAECRKVFDFAKAMGVETIVTEPTRQAFGLLDRLSKEYGITLAIHNHPAPSRYWSPDILLRACKGHSRRIGSCADTGHWMRSGVDPVEAIKKLRGRIVSLHMKDLNEYGREAHDVPWGTGVGETDAILAELRRQNVEAVFSIEYEYNWYKSVPDIAKCVRYFNEAAKRLRKAT